MGEIRPRVGARAGSRSAGPAGTNRAGKPVEPSERQNVMSNSSPPRTNRGELRDRRRACRYHTAGASALLLGWYQADEFLSTSALLEDFSLVGGSIVTARAHRAGESIWVTLPGTTTEDWHEATIIAVERLGGFLTFWRRPYRLRVRFLSTLSYAIFKAAIESGR